MIMGEDYFDLEERLEDAKNFHGDLCAGITIGTRMTLLGLKAIGIEDPKGKIKKTSWLSSKPTAVPPTPCWPWRGASPENGL